MSSQPLPVPNVNNYVLGKGYVKFKPAGASSYIDLGHATEFEIGPKIDFLPHWNFRQGTKFKDFIAIRAKEFGLRMILDEMVTQNLEFFLLGKLNSRVTVLSTTANLTSGSTAAVLATTSGLTSGTSYRINDSGADLTVDTTFAFAGSASITLGGVAIGTNATDSVTITPIYDSIDGGSAPINIGAIRFVGTNDVGVRVQVDAPSVNFAPGGNLALIGDDWQRMELTGDLLGNPSTGSFFTSLVGINAEVGP